MTDHPERPTFIVHLRAEPDCQDPIKSLRYFLKRILRDWKLRCVGLSEIKTNSPDGE
jgi:hypothetical protein